ncbi:MAG: YXWGXW repeat-containing protein, partial [Mucilaginibacter sp.]
MKTVVKTLAISFIIMVASTKLFAQVSVGVGVSVHLAPPALPVYTQPPCPGDGFMWTPGYWAYGDAGYYWVPGVWVRPPHAGLLWTPGYWGYTGGVYAFHAGYWGPHIGFYGGINYGFGYSGIGFGGGVWAGNVFRYNTAVTNVNTTVVHNTYINNTVIRNNTVVNNHTSFNGEGGVNARPTTEEQSAMNERHFQATSQQQSHIMAASHDRNQLAAQNGGHPATTAMNRVNGRKFDQQGRIANGIRSGQLTAGETKNLENGEKNINQQERADRAADNGRLTR